MSAELRNQLELMRRQRIRRHIGALEAQIEQLSPARSLWERVRLNKLRKRIESLTAELNRPMLIDSSSWLIT